MAAVVDTVGSFAVGRRKTEGVTGASGYTEDEEVVSVLGAALGPPSLAWEGSHMDVVAEDTGAALVGYGHIEVLVAGDGHMWKLVEEQQ